MATAAYVTFVYGVLVLVGGVIGGIKAGSTPSLVSGLASGVVAVLSAVLMMRGARSGVFVALVLALALAAFGGKSWLLDQRPFMPRGLIFVLSVAELIAVIPALRQR